MGFFRNFACGIALVSLAGPALADVRTAAFAGASDRPASQTSMFAGASFRLSLNRKTGEARHHTTIGISGMARNPATSDLHIGQGVGLSLAGKGKPEIRIAGVEAGELWQSANLSGGGKTALIVVGAAAALGIAALIAVDSLQCEDEGDPCD